MVWWANPFILFLYGVPVAFLCAISGAVTFVWQRMTEKPPSVRRWLKHGFLVPFTALVLGQLSAWPWPWAEPGYPVFMDPGRLLFQCSFLAIVPCLWLSAIILYPKPQPGRGNP